MQEKRENPFIGEWGYELFEVFGVDSSESYAEECCYFFEDGTMQLDKFNTGTYEIIDDKTIEFTDDSSGHIGLYNYTFQGDTLTLTEEGDGSKMVLSKQG